MYHPFEVEAKKSWLAGIVVLFTIAGFVFAPALNKKLASNRVERKCMEILEAAAQASRDKASEEHTKIIFEAMATPECKAFNDLEKARRDRSGN